MSESTPITLSRNDKEFIRERIAAGEYGSVSEVVRDGLRLLALRKKAVDPTQAALDEAIASGPARPLNREKFFKDMHRRSDRAKKLASKGKPSTKAKAKAKN